MEDPAFRAYETLLDAKYGRERISFRTKWSRRPGGDDGSIPTIDLTVLSAAELDTLEPDVDESAEDEETGESQEG